jgi:hypothetical protein
MKKIVIEIVKKHGEKMYWEQDRKLAIGDWVICVYGDGLNDYDIELTYGKNYPKEGNHYFWKNCPRKAEIVKLLKEKYGGIV